VREGAVLQTWFLSCDQLAVKVGLCTSLASAKLAPYTWWSATGGTTDSEYVFGSDVFFHNGKMMTQTDVQEWSISNSHEQFPYCKTRCSMSAGPTHRAAH
jgi:hypothetical protein